MIRIWYMACLLFGAFGALASDFVWSGTQRWKVASPRDVALFSDWGQSSTTGLIFWAAIEGGYTGTSNVLWDASRTVNDFWQPVATNAPALADGVATFDGTDWLQSSAMLTLTGAMTVTLWYRDDNTSSNNLQVFASDWSDALNGWYLAVLNRRPRALLTRSGSPGVFKISNASNTIPTGTWTHVAFRWSGASNAAIRVAINTTNQTTIMSNAVFSASAPVFSNVMIGARNITNVNSQFTGKLDDLRIYRRDLTDAEVTTIYQWGLRSRP